MALTIQGRTRFAGLPARSTLARWVRTALSRDAQLTLRFVDAREGRQLNRDFRTKDYAPDVLTFSYSTQPTIHADIVICVPALRREARARGTLVGDHLAHLIVHATLHAHGQHHENAGAARKMETHERKILAALGKHDPY